MADTGFILRRFEVSVGRYGDAIILATSRGKALADAWRSDIFEGWPFGEFLKIARCRLSRYQPVPDQITVLGKPALGLGSDGQYVQFVYPGQAVVLNAHPLDVLPATCRPRAYREMAHG
jgi:hypothetical protein